MSSPKFAALRSAAGCRWDDDPQVVAYIENVGRRPEMLYTNGVGRAQWDYPRGFAGKRRTAADRAAVVTAITRTEANT